MPKWQKKIIRENDMTFVKYHPTIEWRADWIPVPRGICLSKFTTLWAPHNRWSWRYWEKVVSSIGSMYCFKTRDICCLIGDYMPPTTWEHPNHSPQSLIPSYMFVVWGIFWGKQCVFRLKSLSRYRSWIAARPNSREPIIPHGIQVPLPISASDCFLDSSCSLQLHY